jgi:8-oxo-dGTP diphosphatase
LTRPASRNSGLAGNPSMHEPSREVASAILVGTCGRILLQQRDDVPDILYPGMIGLFGGHREGNESFLACAQREIEEEIGYKVLPGWLEPLVSLRMDYPANGAVQGAYYVLRGVPVDRLVVTEGSLLAVAYSELPSLLHRMTPSACFVTRVFMMQTGQGGVTLR